MPYAELEHTGRYFVYPNPNPGYADYTEYANRALVKTRAGVKFGVRDAFLDRHALRKFAWVLVREWEPASIVNRDKNCTKLES